MDVCSANRGINFFRLLLIFTLLVSLFCFRDLWLPTAGWNEAYLASDAISEHFQSPSEELANDINDPSSTPITTPLAPVSPDAPPTTQTQHGYEEAPPPEPPLENDCRNLPGADKVMLMLKTGATEIYSKLPTHFLTTFTCVPSFQVYSDLSQTFANVPIHDVIAPVSSNLRENHPDFTLYNDLQKWQREGQDLGKLKGDDGWNLDKWKFLPMLHHAYETAPPETEWFVMIEADTALSWLNLLPWLQTMDPSQPHYLGSPNLIGSLQFAHGGSGIVISRGAMDILEEARTDVGVEYYDTQWEKATARSCCGDAMVAEALLAVNIPLTGAWPLIQGETIGSIDYRLDNWCKVPATWHHVSSIQVDAHWQFQVEWAQQHGWNTPFLYRDIFEKFVAQHVGVNRTKWNNLSRDWKFTATELVGSEKEDRENNGGKLFAELEEYEKRSVRSEEACAEACRMKQGECVQWMWMTGRCHLGRELRLGAGDDERNAIEVEGGTRLKGREHWNCGWVQEYVGRLKGRVCEGESQW